MLHILAFFIYFLSIPTHSPRDFLTGNNLSVCPSHAPVLVFVWKHMCYWAGKYDYKLAIMEHCLVYYTHQGAFWHKNLYTQGQKYIYDKELLTHRGDSDNTFSQMSEPPGYACGGSLEIRIDQCIAYISVATNLTMIYATNKLFSSPKMKSN